MPAVADGSLVFIDNSVNQQTGTIVLKARVKNEKEQLWPGQFVAARIFLKVQENALVLPESAVQPGQDSSFVYVAKDGRAQIHDVQVDRQVDDLVVISKGLDGGEEVIRDVPPSLANGSQIVVRGADGKSGKGRAEGKDGKGKDAGAKGAKGAQGKEARS
jgi:multidrug efflux system membrane fusion protein